MSYFGQQRPIGNGRYRPSYDKTMARLGAKEEGIDLDELRPEASDGPRESSNDPGLMKL